MHLIYYQFLIFIINLLWIICFNSSTFNPKNECIHSEWILILISSVHLMSIRLYSTLEYILNELFRQSWKFS